MGYESLYAIDEPCIVALPILVQYNCVKALLESGANKILCEKPIVLYSAQMKELAELADRKNAKLYAAYNRRYYETVQYLKKKKISKIWYHNGDIVNTQQPLLIQERWTIANSHLLDLLDYFGVEAEKLKANINRWILIFEIGNSIVPLSPLETLTIDNKKIQCGTMLKAGFVTMVKDFLGECKDMKTAWEQYDFIRRLECES